MKPTPRFVGHTGLIELTCQRKLAGFLDRLNRQETLPVLERRWLFTGPPGVAKSELAALLALTAAGVPVPPGASALQLLVGGAAPWNIDYAIGSDITVESVRDWRQRDSYRPLSGGVFVHLLDELDAVPSGPAVTEMRPWLDCLANHRLVIATTNKPVAQLQEQLQSRFKVFQFEPIERPVITRLLMARFALDFDTADDIADRVGGNVRAALSDGDTQADILAAAEDFTAVTA